MGIHAPPIWRRNRALYVRTSRKAEPEELPFLRSCHRNRPTIRRRVRLEPVSVEILTSLPQHREFLPGKSSALVSRADEMLRTEPDMKGTGEPVSVDMRTRLCRWG
jgi:hypothetical protein